MQVGRRALDRPRRHRAHSSIKLSPSTFHFPLETADTIGEADENPDDEGGPQAPGQRAPVELHEVESIRLVGLSVCDTGHDVGVGVGHAGGWRGLVRDVEDFEELKNFGVERRR